MLIKWNLKDLRFLLFYWIICFLNNRFEGEDKTSQHHPYENFTCHFACKKDIELKYCHIWNFHFTYKTGTFSNMKYLWCSIYDALILFYWEKRSESLRGIEPITFWSPVRCSNHWATWTQMVSEGYIYVLVRIETCRQAVHVHYQYGPVHKCNLRLPSESMQLNG